jgi:pyrroloquinoline-quinone synthase
MTRVRDLDRLVDRRHLLKHPFYTAWSHGTLPLDTLREYAAQYYHFEANFPRYVAGAFARVERPEDRHVLLENLIDEEGRSPTHPELWMDFARSLGAHVFGRRPTPATRGLLQVYEENAIGGTAPSALGALYAYESQFPAVAKEKSRGLRENYGIRAKAAHEFFRVHAFADVEHSAAERQLLARYLRGDPRAGAQASRSVRESLAAWWAFLDSFGVHA